MITKRELDDVVTQINAVLDRLNRRLESVEKQHAILLHELQAKVKAKKNG